EGERDFAGLVASMPAGFDVLFYGGSFEGVAILKALREAGLSQLMATGDGCWDVRNFLQPAGDLASSGEGVLVLSATPELRRVEGSRHSPGAMRPVSVRSATMPRTRTTRPVLSSAGSRWRLPKAARHGGASLPRCVRSA